MEDGGVEGGRRVDGTTCRSASRSRAVARRMSVERTEPDGTASGMDPASPDSPHLLLSAGPPLPSRGVAPGRRSPQPPPASRSPASRTWRPGAAALVE